MNEDWKKKVVLFLTSQTVSLFGSSLVQYAITWYITLETQSGVMMTISIMCGFLPTFFISPFAGVWADRYNRKVLIILSDVFIAISTLVLAILFLLGHDSLWLLFVASAIRAVGAGVQTPAVNAFLPQFVPEDRLVKVNATNRTIQSMVGLLSPMLSGALLSLASIEMIFFVDVVTAAIAVFVLLAFLHVPAHAKALSKQAMSYFEDMRQGANYIRSHRYINQFFLFNAVFYVLVAPAAFLTPLQVARTFGGDVWRLTAIEIAFSVGMLLGGAVMAAWGGFRNKIHTMTLSSLAFGIGTAALGVVPIFWIYLGVMGILGITMPLFDAPAIALLQEKVQGDYLGRVFGVLGMISSTMLPLGMLVFGPLADLVRIEWLLVGTGLLLFCEAFLLLGSKALMEAGKPVTSPLA